MLYLKGQCSRVISTTLVMIAFSKIQPCHYQLSEKKRSTGNNIHLLKPEIYTFQLLPEREKMFTQ